MKQKQLLQNDTQFMQSILNGLSAHIAVVDKDGVIIAVNEAWQQFGLENGLEPGKGLVGANYLAVCETAEGPDAEIATEFAAGLRDVIVGNRLFFQLEYPCHAPGKQRWFECRVTRSPEAAGTARAIIAHENISACKLAQANLAKSQHRYQTLFDKVSDAIFLCDLEGNILEANRVACHRLEYDLTDFRQLNMSAIDPIKYGRLQPKWLAQLALEGSALFETVHVSKRGKIIPTEMNTRYFDYDGQVTLLHVARDITGRKETIRAERESRQLAEALVDTAATINISLDLNQILHRVLSNVGKVVPHENATIFLRDGRFAKLISLSQQGKELNINHSLQITIADFPTFNFMLESRRPLIVPDVKKFDGWVKMNDLHVQESGAYLGAPISFGDDLLGFINLSSKKENAFSEKNAAQLQAFAHQAAIAIKNANLYAQVTGVNMNLEMLVQERTKQIQKQKNQLETVIQTSTGKILLLDADGRITLANPKFYTTFALSPDKVVGQSLTAVLPLKEPAALDAQLRQVVETGTDAILEAVVTMAEGREIYLEIRLAPIANGKISGIVCTMHNTTHFKENAQAKDAFVSNVSHELRTPITSIKLYHQLLRAKPDRLATYLPTLERETSRLNHIIEDLLDLSRLDHNRPILKYDHVDLNQMVSNLIADRQPIATSQKIYLEIGELAELQPLQLNARLIEQAISILLTNALDYTQEGGRIWINTLTKIEDDVAWCGIAVCDTGLGISLEEQTKIFGRFYKGKAGQALKKSGTGLGLSIASEIIDLHHGKIEVKSKGIPGQGSTFILWIPSHK